LPASGSIPGAGLLRIDMPRGGMIRLLFLAMILACAGCSSVRDAWTAYQIERALNRSIDPRWIEPSEE
jgi:hypothetical protein